MAVARADGEAKAAIKLGRRVEIAHGMDYVIEAARHESPFVDQTLPSFSVMHQLSTAAHSPIWDIK
jgi:hypothetical protein